MSEIKMVLVGGPSGVGKTTLAILLAKELGATLSAVDDIQVALQAMTTPEQMPELHWWESIGCHGATQEAICESGIRMLTRMGPGVRAVIEDRLAAPFKVVLEGDFIPDVLADLPKTEIAAIFLFDDADQITKNYEAREGLANRNRAEVSVMLGRWIRERMQLVGGHEVSASPHETLLQRVMEILRASLAPPQT